MVWLGKTKIWKRIKSTFNSSFTVYIKTEDIYADIAKDVGTRFDAPSYKLERPLSKGKKWKRDWINKTWIRWENHDRVCCIKIKDIQPFNRWSWWIKIPKGTKRCIIKRKLKSEDYKLCFQATRLENKINHLEKNKLNEDSLPENDKEFIKNNKLILLSN